MKTFQVGVEFTVVETAETEEEAISKVQQKYAEGDLDLSFIGREYE